MKKFVRAFVFVRVVLSSVSGFAQINDATILFNKGAKAFNSENFKAADSLFKLSAALFPASDVYVNLALVNNKLGNQCESCKYLYLAGQYGDSTSEVRYNKYCIRIDSLNYKNNGYYVVFKRQACSEKMTFNFYKRVQSEVDSCIVLVNDSTLTDEVILSESFDIEKYIDTVNHFTDEIFLVVETSPEYPGGNNALMEYLGQNIQYPTYARNNGIQGTVYTSFVIEADGKLSNIKVLHGIGGGCDEEAIRVISTMPSWKPGTQRGKPVRVQFNLPVRFILHG